MKTQSITHSSDALDIVSQYQLREHWWRIVSSRLFSCMPSKYSGFLCMMMCHIITSCLGSLWSWYKGQCDSLLQTMSSNDGYSEENWHEWMSICYLVAKFKVSSSAPDTVLTVTSLIVAGVFLLKFLCHKGGSDTHHFRTLTQVSLIFSGLPALLTGVGTQALKDTLNLATEWQTLPSLTLFSITMSFAWGPSLWNCITMKRLPSHDVWMWHMIVLGGREYLLGAWENGQGETIHLQCCLI